MNAPTVLDRVIEWAAPEWGLRRVAARYALQEINLRSFDAAKAGRRTDNWITSGTGPNAEIGPALTAIRNRTRDIVRNNPHGASAPRKFAAKVVGTGIYPLPLPSETEARRQASINAWTAFADNCDPEGQIDFYGQQKQIVRSVMESGEALLLMLPRPASMGLRVPLQTQVLEPDHLDHGKTEDLGGGAAIIQGVEFDGMGRRVAYWLFDQHPGETTSWAGSRQVWRSRRVDARFVRHIFDPLRPGQVRGISMFAPVVLKMRDAGEYEDAQLVSKKVQAMLVAFRKRAPGPAASPLGTKTDSKGRRVATLSPGTIQDLEPGEDMQFTAPSPVNDYAAYMTSQLRAIAAGIGITYEMLTGDLSQVNYSSARVGLVDFWDVVDQFQWLVLVPQLCRPVWKEVMIFAALNDRALRGELPGVKWRMPRRRWVDPVKEVLAEKEAVRAGFKTSDDVVAEQGEDPDSQRREAARINAENDRLGLVFETDVRRTGGTNPALVTDIISNAAP